MMTGGRGCRTWGAICWEGSSRSGRAPRAAAAAGRRLTIRVEQEQALQEAKEQVWQRFSISWQHNQHWTGPPAYRFDERVNASDLFESQAYTGLVRVGPRDFLVLYNKYWDELYDGMPGCNPSGDSLGCSTAFAMRVSIVGGGE